MEFTGRIIAILPLKEGVSKKTGNKWKAQEYVIEDSANSQYPRRMSFEVFGEDRINLFNIQMGEQLTVSFDIDANQWKDRWINRIRAWKVERPRTDAPSAAYAPPAAQGISVPPFEQSVSIPPSDSDANDDLPF